jgi:DNA excision repair protein ERCC-6
LNRPIDHFDLDLSLEKLNSYESSDSGEEYETEDDDPTENLTNKKKKKNQIEDDGDDELYEKRMKHLKKTDELDHDSFIELDGGLKVPESIWKRLYKFQKTGLKWLWELHSQKCGGILGDEMGLGKTIQTISFLASLKFSKIKSLQSNYVGLGPVLIVAPVTLMGQWVKEFHKWWPYMRVCILHDIGTYQAKTKNKLVDTVCSTNSVLITTYASLLNYEKILLSKNWHYVILDEGHKIRNPDAKVTINAKCFKTAHRIILRYLIIYSINLVNKY